VVLYIISNDNEVFKNYDSKLQMIVKYLKIMIVNSDDLALTRYVASVLSPAEQFFLMQNNDMLKKHSSSKSLVKLTI